MKLFCKLYELKNNGLGERGMAVRKDFMHLGTKDYFAEFLL